MGGTYAVPFLIDSGSFDITGYITVAGSLSAAHKSFPHIPALIIFGSEDPRLRTDRGAYERAFPTHQVIIFNDAPHPAYLRDVQAAREFTDLVQEFAIPSLPRKELSVSATWK